ncbi:indolepyruvate ferredoxin oxidoreductase [mine drainage metagenome]|uniref:Indolepyruvate ferredoxin oxidoreductase n=1 Tax=mine drainage metagenome TaxID=410659 RepID=A0A1J5RS92_9ZZZZ
MDTATAAPLAAALREVSLEDKYTQRQGRIYLSGVQALVRLPLLQRWRDEAAGVNTAGFVSGYRGSPLGGLDQALWSAQKHLEANQVKFQPGVNEDLAATAVWGSQEVGLIGPSPYDGVFAMWYGKGPGVDRCGDVFKHANHFGTSRHGGVLLVAGDDHGAFSSTLPHQSDHQFAAAMIPLLYPCNVQEYVDLGLHGWAMSRFSGCLVGFKALADTVESSASIEADPFRVNIVLPEDFVVPEGGMNARLTNEYIGLQARHQEALMQDYKIYAALAYARANRLNRTMIDAPDARLGIVASGKSYLDVLEALDELGIDERHAREIGVRLFKVSMPWPLEPDSVREFATGLEEILVVEEKRQIVEYQLKEQLYNWREDVRPRVIGKFDEKGEWVHPHGNWLLTSKADFSVAQIARVIAARINRFHQSERISARLAFLEQKEAVLQKAVNTPPRPAYYCSGCPHNTSTRVPEGSLALAGIGCHVMAASIFPEGNKTITHMGGEGATWIGQAPFSGLKHVFANLGDGTYFHSGYLAIRASLSANVNITYKILFNDAVAMTGGQPIDGHTAVPMIASQVAAEGVKRIAVVAEDPARYASREGLPQIATVHHRSELDAVQRELREIQGVSVIIYDQTCAAEKRRRRKRGQYPDPARRIFINDAVCEGCGDCGVRSNCTAILPLETEFGRKRMIDQSSCNKDYSCVQGFCPSFVTVTGGTVRRARSGKAAADLPALAEPALPSLDKPYNILITGIGGTGVITIGALLGMAAHLSGRGASVLDMTGMSQKNGAVSSHVRLAAAPEQIRAQRVATGEADLILGCDLLTSGGQDAISKMRPGRTHAIINSHEQPTGEFARNPDWNFPAAAIRGLIEESAGGSVDFIAATGLATALMGDAIATNLFMLGYAWQKGRIPLAAAAILRAIELNGVAVSSNQQAFAWGRYAAADIEAVTRIALPAQALPLPQSLDTLVLRRKTFLSAYQNRAYAQAYAAFVEQVRTRETALGAGTNLSRAVAHHLFKLMAIKDEYEVARLYASPEFRRKLAETFEGEVHLKFNLAPPLFANKGADGQPLKSEYGAWMLPMFALLSGLRGVRGSVFDPFGRSAERRQERALIGDYRARIERLLPRLTRDNLGLAVAIATVPEHIRGYGHIKQASIEKARQRWQELERQFDAGAIGLAA